MVEQMTGCATHVPNKTERVELLPIMVDVARSEISDLRFRLDAVERERDALRRCLLPVWMGMAEHECVGEHLPDSAVVLSFMGSGASDQVTAGEIRAALTPSQG